MASWNCAFLQRCTQFPPSSLRSQGIKCRNIIAALESIPNILCIVNEVGPSAAMMLSYCAAFDKSSVGGVRHTKSLIAQSVCGC